MWLPVPGRWRLRPLGGLAPPTPAGTRAHTPRAGTFQLRVSPPPRQDETGRTAGRRRHD